MYKDERLVNLDCTMLVRNQFFIRRMEENDLSHVAEEIGIVIATWINLKTFGYTLGLHAFIRSSIK